MERRSRAGSRDVTPLHLAFTGLRVLQKTGENRRYKRRLDLRAGFAIGGLSTTELQPTPTGMKIQRLRITGIPTVFVTQFMPHLFRRHERNGLQISKKKRAFNAEKDARGVALNRAGHRDVTPLH